MTRKPICTACIFIAVWAESQRLADNARAQAIIDTEITRLTAENTALQLRVADLESSVEIARKHLEWCARKICGSDCRNRYEDVKVRCCKCIADDALALLLSCLNKVRDQSHYVGAENL